MDETNIDLGFEVEAGSGGYIAMLLMPPGLADTIRHWGSANIPEDYIYGQDGKGRDKSPHVTVQHGIVSEDPSEIEKMLSEASPVPVELGKISIFRRDDRPYDVVKIEVASPDLMALNETIKANLEVNDTFKDYKPHVTIAYVKKGSGDNYDGDESFCGSEAVLDTVLLAGKGQKDKRLRLKKRDEEPLKESLDYGNPLQEFLFAAQDFEDYLLTSGRSHKDIPSSEAVKIIAELRKSFIE